MKLSKIAALIAAAALILCGCAKGVPENTAPAATGSDVYIPAHTVTSPSAVPPATISTPPTTATAPTTPATEPPEPEYYSVSLICAGDNLIHSSIYNQAKRRAKSNGDEEGYDFGYVYERVEKYIQAADLAILNQETVVTDELEPADYPRFCTPADLGEQMVEVGFDAVSLSNNHVLDQGEEGLLATLRFWDSQPVVRYGAYRDENDMNDIRTLTVNNVTFAFLGYTEHTNGLSLPSDSECRVTYLKELDLIEQQVRRADEIADVVIVSPHFGTEISNKVNSYQKETAKKLVDWGADIIIGTQPHTPQTMEFIEREDGSKAFCFYSLGNFVSAQAECRTLVGILGGLTVTKNSITGEIVISDVKAIPIITQYGGNYHQIHLVPYAEYTEDELRAHGCSDFNQENIDKVLSYIPEEYLSIE